ncbi:hypothetical protein GCM10009434_04660 [Brevundimonas olei]
MVSVIFTHPAKAAIFIEAITNTFAFFFRKAFDELGFELLEGRVEFDHWLDPRLRFGFESISIKALF